jgi:hypothetical protein
MVAMDGAGRVTQAVGEYGSRLGLTTHRCSGSRTPTPGTVVLRMTAIPCRRITNRLFPRSETRHPPPSPRLTSGGWRHARAPAARRGFTAVLRGFTINWHKPARRPARLMRTSSRRDTLIRRRPLWWPKEVTKPMGAVLSSDASSLGLVDSRLAFSSACMPPRSGGWQVSAATPHDRARSLLASATMRPGGSLSRPGWASQDVEGEMIPDRQHCTVAVAAGVVHGRLSGSRVRSAHSACAGSLERTV